MVVMLLVGAVAAMGNSPLKDEGNSSYVTFRPSANYFIIWQGSLEVNLVKNRRYLKTFISSTKKSSILIGPFLVGILPYRPFPLKRP